jgi:hypothetical protein
MRELLTLLMPSLRSRFSLAVEELQRDWKDSGACKTPAKRELCLSPVRFNSHAVTVGRHCIEVHRPKVIFDAPHAVLGKLL